MLNFKRFLHVFRSVKSTAHAHDFVERFFLKKFIKKETTGTNLPNAIMNEFGIVLHPQTMFRQTDLMIDPFFGIFNILNFERILHVFRSVKSTAHAHDFVARFFLKKFIKKGTTDRKVPNSIMNDFGNVSHPRDMCRQTDLMIDPVFYNFQYIGF